MRYGPEHKEATRESIVDAAGRAFRANGYGGAGIEALTIAAGVTNGGFYGHFKTKSDAFRTVMVVAIERLAGHAATLQQTRGDDWLGLFVDGYLDLSAAEEWSEAAALALLSPDVARSDERVRGAFQCAFRILVSTVAAGLDGDKGRAIAILSHLAGAAALARALDDEGLRDAVIAAARDGVLVVAGRGLPAPPRAPAQPGAAPADPPRPSRQTIRASSP